VTIHRLDEVLDARAVAAWLRTPEGEAWSRTRHDREPPQELIDAAAFTPTWWRARGPLRRRQDPCGGPAMASASSDDEGGEAA
jgi:hypothetical protein